MSDAHDLVSRLEAWAGNKLDRAYEALDDDLPCKAFSLHDEAAGVLRALDNLLGDEKRRWACALCAWERKLGERATGRERAGIYVASKTTHAPMWLSMRADGVPIISTWIDEAGEGQSKSIADLWTRCVREASSADAVIVYVEPGEAMKGALVEIGAALASGVPVFHVGPMLGRWTNHPLCKACETLNDAFAAVSKMWSEKAAREGSHGNE